MSGLITIPMFAGSAVYRVCGPSNRRHETEVESLATGYRSVFLTKWLLDHSVSLSRQQAAQLVHRAEVDQLSAAWRAESAER